MALKHFIQSFCLLNMNQREINRVIEMAWEDRTPFDAIYFQFGLTEKEVIQLMRNQLKLKKLEKVAQKGTR